MTESTTPNAADEAQREALRESEKNAAENHPDNFKDEENDEKIVEIGPDMTEAPIKGIDPEKSPEHGKLPADPPV